MQEFQIVELPDKIRIKKNSDINWILDLSEKDLFSLYCDIDDFFENKRENIQIMNKNKKILSQSDSR